MTERRHVCVFAQLFLQCLKKSAKFRLESSIKVCTHSRTWNRRRNVAKSKMKDSLFGKGRCFFTNKIEEFFALQRKISPLKKQRGKTTILKEESLFYQKKTF
jgi:hypothetical protein